MIGRRWMLLAVLSPALAMASGAPSSAPKAADGVKAADKGVVCTREKTLGSNMSKRVCTTAEQRQATREKAQKNLQQLGSCANNDPGTCIGDI